MEFRAAGERFVVRLESRESVRDRLTNFLQANGIGFANVSATGAVKSIRLGDWDAGRQLALDSKTVVADAERLELDVSPPNNVTLSS